LGEAAQEQGSNRMRSSNHRIAKPRPIRSYHKIKSPHNVFSRIDRQTAQRKDHTFFQLLLGKNALEEFGVFIYTQCKLRKG